MMDEVAALDELGAILRRLPDDRSTHPERLEAEGYILTGVVIVGQYVGPDGQSTGMVPCGIGNMNAWTQEGIHRWAARRIADGDHVRAED